MSVHKYVDQNSGSKKRFERLKLGTNSDGVVLDITRKGIEINGYYTKHINEDTMALLREPLRITWEDLDMMKNQVMKPNKQSGNSDGFEVSEVSEKYLEKLPKVHINNVLYYVDIENKTIRPVDRPNLVSKLKSD